MRNTTPTLALRKAALVAAINAEDIRQGRPADVADRTGRRDDLNVRLDPNTCGGRILLADVDNHCPASPFAVLTLDEAATAKEICLERDLTDDDCVEVKGVTFVVVYLG